MKICNNWRGRKNMRLIFETLVEGERKRERKIVEWERCISGVVRKLGTGSLGFLILFFKPPMGRV